MKKIERICGTRLGNLGSHSSRTGAAYVVQIRVDRQENGVSLGAQTQ